MTLTLRETRTDNDFTFFYRQSAAFLRCDVSFYRSKSASVFFGALNRRFCCINKNPLIFHITLLIRLFGLAGPSLDVLSKSFLSPLLFHSRCFRSCHNFGLQENMCGILVYILTPLRGELLSSIWVSILLLLAWL